MACSSVTVVASSLLLKWWKRPRWMEVEGEVELAWSGSKKDGLVTRLLSRVKGNQGKKKDLGDRGAYVPLENYDAV